MKILNKNYQNFFQEIINIKISIGPIKRMPKMTVDEIIYSQALDFANVKYDKVEGLLINGLDAKKYPSMINKLQKEVIKEVQNNIDYPANKSSLPKYFKKLIRELEQVSDNIKEGSEDYEFFNLKITKELSSDYHKYRKEISGIFKVQKNNIRPLIIELAKLEEEVLMNTSVVVTESETESHVINYAPAFKKIQLLDSTNLLVTLFYDLFKEGYIKTSPGNLEAFFQNSFRDKHGKDLNKTTIHDYFKESKEEKRVSLDKRIHIPKKD